MKRTEFIKNLALTVGGTTLFACETDLVRELMPKIKTEEITIEEAKYWFNNEYLKKFNSLRIANEKYHNRRAKWEKAKNCKDVLQGDFIMVPLEYDENKIPGLLIYDKNNEYRTKLRDGFTHPIVEYLIVYKKNNQNEAFLAQLAYDPYASPKTSDKLITLDQFSGWLMMADWDETLQKGIQYKKGQQVLAFDKSSNKKAKINDCVYTNFEYTTVFIQPCNGIASCLDVTFTLHRDTQVICNGDASTYTSQDQFGFTSYFSGNPNYWTAYNNTQYSYPTYNIASVVSGSGPDRNYWNNRLVNVCEVLGFKAGIAGLTWDSAEAMARAIGARMSEFRTPQGAMTKEAIDLFETLGKVGRKVGFVGLAFDSIQLGLAWFDGEWNINDVKAAAPVALGLYALWAGGWIAVVIGGVTILVAIKN